MAQELEGATTPHRQPRRGATEGASGALVCAFPEQIALPLPPNNQPVGRAWFAAHGVADTELSGRHLKLSGDRGSLTVEDVGSTNGSWLNGRRLSQGHPQPFRDGDLLRVGTRVFVYRESFVGDVHGSSPLGGLVAPFGLRGVAGEIEALCAHPPNNVLIIGETGTGKEFAAAAVAAALRPGRSYAAVNLAGVAAGVFESQLFGHVAGAFSDARTASKGIICAHEGGAVFLDEIGELPLDLQPKLLRLLENREVLAVGAERPATVDVLLIAATNRDLPEMVDAGTFRQDLCARLAMARIDLPPLRERREDIYAIAQAVGGSGGLNLTDPDVSEVEAIERLLLDSWPDNVRGLAATLRKIAGVDPEPGLHHWSVDKVMGPAPAPTASEGPDEATIRSVVEACGGNESEAARRLGISRGKLRRLLSKA